MFIVIEGIDGAGKGRQREELVAALSSDQIIDTVGFPDHDSVIYHHVIHPAIHDEISIDSKTLFSAFALDQLLWKEKIKKTVKSKTEHFIADGYFTTNIAYQCILEKALQVEDALDYAKLLSIPIPDLVIFLDVDPKIAMQRKLNEEGHTEGLDKYEGSIKKQELLRKAFKNMASDNIFGKWVVINGDKSIEEVRDSIISIANPYIKS